MSDVFVQAAGMSMSDSCASSTATVNVYARRFETPSARPTASSAVQHLATTTQCTALFGRGIADASLTSSRCARESPCGLRG